MNPSLYDVVAVKLETKRVRLMATDRSQKDAEAVIEMAFARRGVEEEFFAYVPAGTYNDGDAWSWREEWATVKS